MQHPQLTETRIQLLFGVLAHAARVDDDDVGVAIVSRGLVACLVEQSGHAFRVVDVHLTPERLDEIPLCHPAETLDSSTAFAFAFRFLFSFRVPARPSGLRATSSTLFRRAE